MREPLLRQALESKKTTSRRSLNKQASAASSGIPSRSSSKANSAANSRAGSTTTSHAGSRVNSSAGSDDDIDSMNGYESDTGAGDFDIGIKLKEQLETIDSWQNALENRIGNLLGRGKRHEDERLEDLRWYTGILQNHHASDEIQPLLSELVKHLLRASSSENEVEACLALKALSVTVLTDQSEDYFEQCASPLKSVVNNSTDEDVKSAALQTLSIITFLTGTLDDCINVSTFLLEIVESDGSSVLAGDSAVVVTSSMKALSLISSNVPDFDSGQDYLQDVDREFSQELIEALSEQLESSAAPVQIAAAEAIALLFEKSYRRATIDDQDQLKENVNTGEMPTVVQKYSPYRQTNQLLLQLQETSKGSSKSVAKGDRRALNDTIRDVAQSLENPGWGPGWRAGQGWKAKGRDERNAGQKRDLGPSIRVKTDPRGHTLLVETWWTYIRVKELRSLLGHGFMEHFAENPVLEQVLVQEYDGANEEESDDEESDEEIEQKPVPKIEVQKPNGKARKGRKNA